MNIGIDMDGVVFDSEKHFYEYAEFFDKKIGGGGIKNIGELKARSRYEWSHEDADKFFEECCVPCEEKAGFTPNAIEVLNKLKKDGHKLIGITARGFYYPIEIEITERKLKEAGFYLDKIYYKQLSKVNACIENKIDIMIDDNFKIISEIIESKIPCIYFKWRDTLKDFNSPLVTAVKSWDEVYKIIRTFDSAKTFN